MNHSEIAVNYCEPLWTTREKHSGAYCTASAAQEHTSWSNTPEMNGISHLKLMVVYEKLLISHKLAYNHLIGSHRAWNHPTYNCRVFLSSLESPGCWSTKLAALLELLMLDGQESMHSKIVTSALAWSATWRLFITSAQRFCSELISGIWRWVNLHCLKKLKVEMCVCGVCVIQLIFVLYRHPSQQRDKSSMSWKIDPATCCESSGGGAKRSLLHDMTRRLWEDRSGKLLCPARATSMLLNDISCTKTANLE